MKKYILLSIIAALFFEGCVKDDQPAPVPSIVINELITKDLTDPYYVDGVGDGADWIELYNNGSIDVNIAGMWVTDNPGVEADYIQIPETDAVITTIQPEGFIVLVCGAVDSQGNDVPTSIADTIIFLDMGLSSSGDNFVALYDADKIEVDISDDFNGLEDDKSFGRVTDGGNGWDTLTAKTPRASNEETVPVAGSLIINEFMASNDNIPVPGDNGDFPDWIEVYNNGDTPIDMGGWYTTDDIADTMQYKLPVDDPSLTTVHPNGYLILYCDGTGEGLHTNFKLSSGGEAIAITSPDKSYSEAYTYCDNGCNLYNPGTDFSNGRNGDGAEEWVIFDPESATPPTPGAANGSQK